MLRPDSPPSSSAFRLVTGDHGIQPFAFSDSTTLSEPLYQMKLLAAIRSGDPARIHPFLAEIGKERKRASATLTAASRNDNVDTAAAALHLAVRCATKDTISLILSHRAISPNGIHPPGSGTTPLHLASSLGRVDVVELLLEQETIDDTIRDSHGHTCRDVARGSNVKRVIDDSRAFLNASYRSLLRSYILSPSGALPSQALLDLLASPRVKFVDLSYLDDSTGRALLHEAAQRRDLRLIELAVRAGADVFVRDKRGKVAYEGGAGKDDKVHVFLRQFANSDTSLLTSSNALAEPPSPLRGYLNKYANMARGYNTRWFVLEDGVLSYYRHQDDETIASRGTISMKTAVLVTVDKLRFEVHSMRTETSPVQRNRGHVQKWYMKANHPVEAHRWAQALSRSIEWYQQRDGDGIKRRRSGEITLSSDEPAAMKGRSRSGNETQGGDSDSNSGDMSDVRGHTAHVGAHDRADMEDSGAEDSDDWSMDAPPPHDAEFSLQGNLVTTQMTLLDNLLRAVANSDAAVVADSCAAVIQEFAKTREQVDLFVSMARKRDDFWQRRLERESARQEVWEESLATVVREGEMLERELRTRSRLRGSRFFDSAERRSPSTPRITRNVEDSLSSHPVVEIVEEAPTPSEPMQEPPFPTEADAVADEYTTDEDDEFFDAIESDNIPNLIVPQPLTLRSPRTSVSPEFGESCRMSRPIWLTPYREVLRVAAERPPTSLWAVLKHSIGKDLTRISFPVFFNEPTSMLQRMAEDMEFSECCKYLDVAAKESDPLRRIAYVAAFGMSNYSSTIGRIAKPFNPMLSETFEYVRLDKEYKQVISNLDFLYFSEQVSHHPPISACWAESPRWKYYGEVDAQNKFMGKSFEIRPTGVAHADLIIPEEWGPNYPKAGSEFPGRVIEHYSWKKVTTNVSGFILGSPTIDHYGDMIITNHRTGDKCVLTFKPRGWRGKDAYEIAGSVITASGRVAYEIAGRWNYHLIARQADIDGDSLHPDLVVSERTPSPAVPEFLLLWRNSEKQKGSPFNLTPFAISLNNCPADNLKPYLPPTDCRLRRDQRAFELGRYELANRLKMEQEDLQRATRRLREEGRTLPHSPRWFSAQTDGDTGERVWQPARVHGKLEYWVEREKAFKCGGDPAHSWRDVQPIFIPEPDYDAA
ncbi:hypothetical protein FISHEDRAFT_44834 [Fistulina hepatica ATCC 64428]|uniref:PH domain-containing protein n=1 Tax=Fistulina hepatica ATCC 64428 TaxID=1128425 RepID=A0A0D7ACM0_9AGAR|nr:hypothetical protein FISHEDRAFT_44834 [Fistulina hepatica ATCC 64428]